MQYLSALFQILDQLGSTVLLPVFIAVAALCWRARPKAAIQIGLLAGAGFLAVRTLASPMRTYLSETYAKMAEQWDVTTPIADVGVSEASRIALASEIGVWIIPLFLVVNLLMLLVRGTQTVNLDIWNYWYAAFSGVLVQTLTANFSYALITTVLVIIIQLVMTDLLTPRLQETLQVKTVTVSNFLMLSCLPIAWIVNWIFDRIPGIRKIHFAPEQLKKRKLGVLSEPMVWGILYALLLGFFTGGKAAEVFQDAAMIGMVIYVVPYVGLLLREVIGLLTGLADKCGRQKAKSSLGVYLGVSAQLGMTSSTALLSSLIVAPLLIFASKYIPLIQVIPVQDMLLLPLMMAGVAAVCRGDLLRSVVAGVTTLITMLMTATYMTGMFSLAAQQWLGNYYEDSVQCVSLLAGSPILLLTTLLGSYGIPGIALMALIAALLMVLNRNRIVYQKQSVYHWKAGAAEKGSREKPAGAVREEQKKPAVPQEMPEAFRIGSDVGSDAAAGNTRRRHTAHGKQSAARSAGSRANRSAPKMTISAIGRQESSEAYGESSAPAAEIDAAAETRQE